ncbi:hypothetical protein [Mucisphaera sp.]|uniref:hypothetical protein n=1 Tax=Mucisphaera sp. TaxID=2913024 RepID=UPI003D145BC2
MKNPTSTLLTAALLASGLSAAQTAMAANTLPFTETFSDAGGDGFDLTPFTDSSDYPFFVNNTDGTFDVDMTTGFRSYSTVEVAGLNPVLGTTVTMSMDFDMLDDTVSTTRIGFVLFGGIADTQNDPDAFLAFISEPSGFNLPSFGTPEMVLENRPAISPNPRQIVSDFWTVFNTRPLNYTTFTLSVTAAITDSNPENLGVPVMELDYSLFETDNPGFGTETGTLVSVLEGGVIPAGDFFGFAVDRNSAGPEASLKFDNFSMSVTGNGATSTPGDFNADTVVDAADIDLLTAAIRAGSSDSTFDLDGLNGVDAGDLAEILALIGTVPGDANLDFEVDLIDLSALATSFGSTGGWGEGNFNSDDVVDLIDLSLLATNFGTSAAAPEPGSLAILALAGLAMIKRR